MLLSVLAGIKNVRRVIGGFPLVAIGGISRSNVKSVFEAGADSAAVISDALSPMRIISRVIY